ncbi:MAG: NAD(+)/NADH kinase [Gemmataceae bacterium]|nr:NAD(+)/NADH kinase [Gemmataceae bacterium]
MRFFILGNARKPQVVEAAARSRPLFDRLGTVVAFDLRQELDLSGLTADVAVVFGGDGAILHAARQLGYRQIPVLGVNLGKLGFLADLPPDELARYLPEVVAGNYRVTSHLMFECEYHLDGPGSTRQVLLGLNEVVVHARAVGHVAELDLLIDGEPVTAFTGDGLILSTPIGSTAHSLSAGGPILSQELPAFTITPICPHTLTYRPLVDAADKLYTIRVRRAEGAALTADGQALGNLAEGQAVTVRRAPVAFQLVKVPGRTYYQTLRDKLRWGVPPNYRTEPPGG